MNLLPIIIPTMIAQTHSGGPSINMNPYQIYYLC
jgi:hypothetical protein